MEQELGEGWKEGLHPDDAARYVSASLVAFESRLPFRLEYRLRKGDGTYALVVCHGAPQYMLDGRFFGYVGSVEELKRQDEPVSGKVESGKGSYSVRQALREIAANSRPLGEFRGFEARKPQKVSPGKTSLLVQALLSCLETSPTPMIVLNRRGRGVYCNQAFRNFAARAVLIAGINEEGERSGSEVSRRREASRKRVTPDCAPEAQAWLDSYSIPDALDVRLVVQPLPTAEGEWTCFSIIDTSHERQRQLLERAFLHDLLNAAGGIEMLSDLLAESTLPEEPDEYVKLLQTGVKHLLSEIYNERMFLENSNPSLSVCDGRELLDLLVNHYRNHAIARGRRIALMGDAAESARVLSDRTRLVRVLDNMLRNAVEVTPEGGLVTLGHRLIEGEVEFWVHNPGVLSESARMKILRRSFSAKGDSQGRDTQGLSFLRELYLKGTVAFSSDKEHGTTFSVRYPAAFDTVYSKPDQASRKHVS